MRSMIAAATLAVTMLAAPGTSFAGGLGHIAGGLACPLDMLHSHFSRPARAERAAKPAKAAPVKVAKAEKAAAKPKK